MGPTIDLSPAPGRYPFPLTPRWTAVALQPLPGRLVLGLFLDGVPVEVVTEPDDVRAYLCALRGRRPSRSSRRRRYGTSCVRGRIDPP